MPQGVVVFAGNNCRLKGWAFRNTSGKLVGYVATDKAGNLISTASTGGKLMKRYTIAAFAGPQLQVDAPATLKRSGNEARTVGNGAVVGTLTKEEVVDANGTVKVRSDSTGMFEVVAAKLKKIHSLPTNLVKEFSNVHDDFAEGGTKDDSRANFFKAIKTAPGVGTASELDFFAYSGHGTFDGLPSAGINRGHAATLATEIKRLVKSTGTVVFYACCTGTKNGFAQQLSGLLPSMTVWGHLKAGPASTNPNKVKFINGKQQPFLDTLTPEQRTQWDNYMRGNADFYARYPFMTFDAMKAEIGIGGGAASPQPKSNNEWTRTR